MFLSMLLIFVTRTTVCTRPWYTFPWGMRIGAWLNEIKSFSWPVGAAKTMGLHSGRHAGI